MGRWNRVHWADYGLSVLATEGPEGLSIDALEKGSGRTRGSLYYHFQSHDGFLSEVVDRWAELHCTKVIEAVQKEDVGAGSRLNRLAMALDFRLERNIRRLAESRPLLRQKVIEVDERRIKFLVDLHSGAPDPRTLAELEYAAYVGGQHLEGVISYERLERMFRYLAKIARSERSPVDSLDDTTGGTDPAPVP